MDALALARVDAMGQMIANFILGFGGAIALALLLKRIFGPANCAREAPREMGPSDYK